MPPALYPGRSRFYGEGVAAIGLMAIGGKDMPFDRVGAGAKGARNGNYQNFVIPCEPGITKLDGCFVRTRQFDAGEFEVQALGEGQVQLAGRVCDRAFVGGCCRFQMRMRKGLSGKSEGENGGKAEPGNGRSDEKSSSWLIERDRIVGTSCQLLPCEMSTFRTLCRKVTFS